MKYILTALTLICVLLSCKENNSKSTTNNNLNASNIDSLLNLYPDSVELLLFRGNLAYNDLRFSDALKDAAKAFRLDSNNNNARLLYAQTMINKDNRSIDDIYTAQNHFKSLTIINPKNTDAYIGLATTYRLTKDMDNAFKYVNQALKIDKHKKEAYALKGSMYMEMENYTLAKSSYHTAIQQDPNYFEAYFCLATIYNKEDNPVALEHYETASKLRPEDDEVLYSWAFALEYFGKPEEAKALYRKLAKSEDNYYQGRGYFHQAHIKQREGIEIDSAIYLYSKAIDAQKDYFQAYHNRGMCYEVKRNFDMAKLDYLSALKYHPEFTLSQEAYDKIKNK